MFKGSAKDIIKQYHNIIGKPSLPPFWALGWNAASWTYTNIGMIDANVNQYNATNIPLEGVWFD